MAIPFEIFVSCYLKFLSAGCHCRAISFEMQNRRESATWATFSILVFHITLTKPFTGVNFSLPRRQVATAGQFASGNFLWNVEPQERFCNTAHLFNFSLPCNLDKEKFGCVNFNLPQFPLKCRTAGELNLQPFQLLKSSFILAATYSLSSGLKKVVRKVVTKLRKTEPSLDLAFTYFLTSLLSEVTLNQQICLESL